MSTTKIKMYTLHLKNLKAASCVQCAAFSFILTMQKDLSEWIDVSRVEIDYNIAKEISKSITLK
jgi:hypothetical protein